jgi:hypothetical protein
VAVDDGAVHGGGDERRGGRAGPEDEVAGVGGGPRGPVGQRPGMLAQPRHDAERHDQIHRADGQRETDQDR